MRKVSYQWAPGPAKASNEEADEDDDARANALIDGLPTVRIKLHCQQHRHHHLPRQALCQVRAGQAVIAQTAVR